MIKNQLVRRRLGENILILPDIRSAQNVGAIFRTAEAAGISKIFLTGVSPCPLDRFNKVRKDVAKSALGAELIIPWKYEKSLPAIIRRLRREKFKIIAIEQDKKSVDYKKVKLSNKNVFIVGTEVTGLPKSILNKCDVIAEIPMLGKKESLNVSVATGIALFRILNI